MGTKSLRREAERQGFLLDTEMIKSYGSSVFRESGTEPGTNILEEY